MDDLTEVKLLMEGGRADGLWVRHVRVEEGLCRLPQAEIEIVAKKAIAMDDLEGYVEQPAALEISRIDVGTTRRTTRWFSGIVTSVEHEGRLLASQGGSVFGYRMTVSPNLVNLAYSQSDFQYADIPAIDVVKKILDRYNVAYMLGDRLPDAAKEKHDYFQAEESDYAFLLGVLSACGLSFTYRMPRQEAGAKNVKGPMLHIGRGTGLPYASDFAENGNGSDPLRLFSCDRERSDATYRRMDHWRMRKSIGTDRVEVGFVDGNGAEAFGSAGAENSLRRMRLNSALSAVSDKGSVGRVTEEYLKALALDTIRWQGRTSCLEAMSGCRLEIHGFYDETGGANDNPVEALVCSTVLDGSQALPSDLVGGGEENVTRIGIALACMDGKKVNDDLGDAALGKIDTLGAMGFMMPAPSREPINLGLGKPSPQPNNRLAIVPAVVTNAKGYISEGSYDYTGDSVELMAGYTFTAVPFDTTGKPLGPNSGGRDNRMIVRLVMPVGGMGQGLFRVPRIGDRILVARISGKGSGIEENGTKAWNFASICYLQGYLPDASMPFSEDVNECTAGVSVATVKRDQNGKITKGKGGKPEVVKFTTSDTAKNSEMLALRYQSVGTTKVEKNTVGIRRGKSGQNTCSELAFYNTHVGREYDPRMNECSTQISNDPQSENPWATLRWDAENKEIPPAEFDSYDPKDEKILKADGKGDRKKAAELRNDRVLANFQSVGDMQISANKSLDINARDITISGPGWKQFQRGALNKGGRVVLRDINEFEVTANQRIRLMVGSNCIVIDRNGILLNAARGGQVSNSLLSSSVSVVGCRGVEVSGMNVNLTGTFGASIGDTAGANYFAYAGMSGIGGSLIKNCTMTDAGAKLRLIGFLTMLGTSFVSDNVSGRQNPGTSEARLSSVGGLIGNIVDTAFYFGWGDTAKFGGLNAVGLGVVSLLKAIADFIDSVGMIVRMIGTMKGTGGSWETWERPFSTGCSRSDIVVIFSGIFKLLAWGTAWAVITREVVRAGYNTKVTIKPKEIVIDAPEIDKFSVKTTQNNGILAGQDLGSKTEHQGREWWSIEWLFKERERVINTTSHDRHNQILQFFDRLKKLKAKNDFQ